MKLFIYTGFAAIFAILFASMAGATFEHLPSSWQSRLSFAFAGLGVLAGI